MCCFLLYVSSLPTPPGPRPQGQSDPELGQADTNKSLSLWKFSLGSISHDFLYIKNDSDEKTHFLHPVLCVCLCGCVCGGVSTWGRHTEVRDNCGCRFTSSVLSKESSLVDHGIRQVFLSLPPIFLSVGWVHITYTVMWTQLKTIIPDSSKPLGHFIFFNDEFY